MTTQDYEIEVLKAEIVILKRRLESLDERHYNTKKDLRELKENICTLIGVRYE